MGKEMEYTCYSVGDKFDKVMASDGAVFEIADQMFNVVIGMSDISDTEVSILDAGELDMYLSVVEGIVFVTAKFGNSFIFDMPFNAGLYKEFDTDFPENQGLMGVIFIIDNKDNIIRGMRAYGFDAEFTKKLYKFAKQQREEDVKDYDSHLKKVYDKYASEEIIDFAVAKNVVRRIM